MEIKVYDFASITGATHKDLGSEEVVLDARRKGLDGIVVISSGNYVNALETAIDKIDPNMRLYNLVGRTPENANEVKIPLEKILRTNEERVKVVNDQISNVGKIADYTDFIPEAYSEHAEKIIQDEPDFVLCPIGSGKLWKTIVDKIKETGSKTKVIGVTPEGKNAFIDNSRIKEESIANKLTAPYTKLADEVMSKVASSKHQVVEVSEDRLRKAYKIAKEQDLDCEPSSSVGFVVYDKEFRKRYGILEDSKVVVVSTGNGINNRSKEVKERKRKSVWKSIAGIIASLSIVGLGYLGIDNFQEKENERLEYLGDITKEQPEALKFVADYKGKSIIGLSNEDITIAYRIGNLSEGDSSQLPNLINSKKAQEPYQDRAFRIKN